MRANPTKRADGAVDESCMAALARAATESHAVIAADSEAAIAQLKAQALRYQTAIDAITQGVCLFDGEGRLALCNRRFAEIYRLSLDQVSPGSTLREITERRVAAGTCPVAAEHYLSFCASNHSCNEARSWTTVLRNGRTIQIRHQPTPDGGWVSTHEDITELPEKRAVADERISLQALIDGVPDYLYIKDVESRFVVVNKALASDNGRAMTCDMIGLTDFDLHPSDAARGYHALEQEILATGRPMFDLDEHAISATGEYKYLASTKAPLRNDKGEIIGLIGIGRDVTARKKADLLRDGQAQILEMIAMGAPLEAVLDRLVRLIESQLTGIVSSILLLDEDRVHLRHGAAPSLPEAYTRAIDGVRIGPNVGSCGTAAFRREAVVVEDITTDPLWADYKGLAAAHGLRSCWSTPILSHQNAVLGTFAMYSATARAPTEAETRLVGIAAHIAGIAIERRLAEDRIQFIANHDALTGLPNRGLIKDRLTQAVKSARRHGRWASVAFVDLDNFKCINDSLGHSAGDELLKVVASRMVACVKPTDTVVRLGGDEFVIVLFNQPKSEEIVAATLQKIQTAIAEPVQLEGHTFRVTSSFGVANYPNDGTDAETLLANADAAMYRAKEIGCDNFQFYTPELNAKVREKFMLQEALRNAVPRREFVLHYQPLVDLRSRRVFAAEALIRWNHPNFGLIPPPGSSRWPRKPA